MDKSVYGLFYAKRRAFLWTRRTGLGQRGDGYGDVHDFHAIEVDYPAQVFIITRGDRIGEDRSRRQFPARFED